MARGGGLVLPPGMVPTKSQAVLAGIAAGAIGGTAVLAYMALVAVANEDPWWRYANLIASMFYGAPALRAGPGLATLSGAGLEIVVSGLVGVAFALAFARWFRTRRLTLLGAVAGLAWMYIAGAITGRLAPLIPLYTPTASGVVAHLLFGLCLGSARWFLPAPPAPPPVPVTPEMTVVEPVAAEQSGSVETPAAEIPAQDSGETESDTRGAL